MLETRSVLHVCCNSFVYWHYRLKQNEIHQCFQSRYLKYPKLYVSLRSLIFYLQLSWKHLHQQQRSSPTLCHQLFTHLVSLCQKSFPHTISQQFSNLSNMSVLEKWSEVMFIWNHFERETITPKSVHDSHNDKFQFHNLDAFRAKSNKVKTKYLENTSSFIIQKFYFFNIRKCI